MDLTINFIDLWWVAVASGVIFLGWREIRRRRISFETAVTALELAIRGYREAMFQQQLKRLRRKFDLRQGSPTQAQQQFLKARRVLLEESARRVIRLLSPELRACLMTYFSEEGLALLVMKLLERE